MNVLFFFQIMSKRRLSLHQFSTENKQHNIIFTSYVWSVFFQFNNDEEEDHVLRSKAQEHKKKMDLKVL